MECNYLIIIITVSREEYCSVCGQKDTKTNGKKDQKEELCTWVFTILAYL